MTFLQFCIAFHPAIVACTVLIGCLWLETFCALRRAYRPAIASRSFVKMSFYLSERLFIHVAYVT
jgi:hypothetical protein